MTAKCVRNAQMRRLPNVLGAAAALVGAVLYVLLLQWIGDMCNSGIELSAAQLGAAFAYGVALSVWIAAEVGFVTARNMSSGLAPAFELEPADNEETQKLDGTQLPEVHVLFGALRADMLPQLRAAAEFSLIMGYVFVCDRTTFFAAGPKDVSSLKFWGLWALITMVALVSIRPVHKSLTKPLQRDQTEEWKGWMQLMFILYHYFEQKELYNAIRVYIACYVWMTGFGNFSYYYVKADFTLARFAQMMWRLNFFVFFVCVTMDNEYMLYYICPMHTFFTWTVFIPLWIGHKHNKRNLICALKIGLSMVVSVVLYDVPGVFKVVFYPFRFLLAFHDPLHPEFKDELHEWFFRSNLDHLIWVFGMACALGFPYWESALSRLEERPAVPRIASKALVMLLCLGIGAAWYLQVFVRGKYAYNAIHPYTSWVPIAVYMVLRNLSPALRKFHLHMFAWCGKVTLETYILQFHIWMKTTGINGSPKYLMVWVPDWFWLNMVLTTTVFIFVSYRVFCVTVVLRDVCIPNEPAAIAWRSAIAVAAIAAFYALGLSAKVLQGS